MATSTHQGLSRGHQLEVAVDSLSSWYFEYDEPKSGWHNERIHPLPEESSATEPQHDVVESSFVATSTNNCTTHSAKSSVAATQTDHHQRYSRYNGASSNNQDENEAKPPAVSSAKSNQMEPPRSSIRDTDRRSSGSNGGATVASTGSSAGNDLVVSGYTIRGSEKRVMYHIDVLGYESQLQTYTIRRSYTDFKHLHQSLTEILEARREHYHRTKAAVAAAFARHSMPDREKSSRDTRASLDGSSYATTHTLRYSSGMRSNQDNDASASTAAAASVPTTSDDANEAWFISFTLPPLPNAGFLSFWRRHDRTHVENRCEMFQEILRAASMHRDLRESYAMQSFLSIAPCAIRDRGSSYVSLCEYSVPRLALEEETRERKKLARERRRNSSAHPTTASEQ